MLFYRQIYKDVFTVYECCLQDFNQVTVKCVKQESEICMGLPNFIGISQLGLPVICIWRPLTEQYRQTLS